MNSRPNVGNSGDAGRDISLAVHVPNAYDEHSGYWPHGDCAADGESASAPRPSHARVRGGVPGDASWPSLLLMWYQQQTATPEAPATQQARNRRFASLQSNKPLAPDTLIHPIRIFPSGGQPLLSIPGFGSPSPSRTHRKIIRSTTGEFPAHNHHRGLREIYNRQGFLHPS